MKKFCNFQLPSQIVITLMIISVISSFFSIIHSSLVTISCSLIMFLALLSASAFMSVRKKTIPDIILIYAAALKVILTIIDAVAFKEQFFAIITRNILGLILGTAVVVVINKIAEKSSCKPVFSEYEIKITALMGFFSGYICTYSSLMIAFVSSLLMKLFFEKKSGKSFEFSLQPFILCGYFISLMIYSA